MNESRNTTVGGSADADAKQKTIVLAFDRAALSGDAADQDIIAQLDAIEKAVKENGYSPLRLPVTLDLEHLGSRLRGFKPDLVFNLVESLDRSDRLQTLVPLVLEDWNILFTGCGSSAMLLSNNKLASKQLLADKGLPVPDCVYLGADGSPRVIVATGGDEGEAEKKTRQGWNQPSDNQTGIRIENRRWIIKAVESHASVHLDDHSVASFASLRHLAARLADEARQHGKRFFAEEFIEGREFNLSLLQDTHQIKVLPPAEIVFVDFPADKPKIVGFAAKWDEKSPEYQSTRRRFPAAETGEQAKLLDNLGALALAAWHAVQLSGYARVDFRVDEKGNPFILEINANPCLAPDAGFAAAAEQAGMDFPTMCDRIIAAALSGR